MKPDDEGFLYPEILDKGKCIECDKCLNLCPVRNAPIQKTHNLEAYSGFFSDNNKLKLSASGGLASAISERIIKKNGVVCGVEYSEDFTSAFFSLATTFTDLEKFKTSKYIQANKSKIYKEVLHKLNQGKIVLFIGLPCEVAAMKVFLSKEYENLYTCDLICHGPTSSKVQKEFCEILRSRYNSDIIYFSLRYKKEGWKPPYIRALFANGAEYLEKFADTCYGIAFQFFKRPSCNFCKFKGNARVADITLGDYHSLKKTSKFYNNNGVSIGIINTKKGYELLKNLEGFVLSKADLNTALRNRALHDSIKMKPNRNKFSRAFKKKGLNYACRLGSVKFLVFTRRLQLRIHRFLAIVKNRIIAVVLRPKD